MSEGAERIQLFKPDSYFEVSRSATYGFLAALPLWLAYEVLILLANSSRLGEIRVSADLWIKRVLSSFGAVGMFGLGLVPSGSRDPFGLRRVAQGLVRIVLEAELPLDLDLVAALAARQYGDRIDKGGDEILLTLRPFLHDRVRYLLGRQGYAYDTIEAALAAGSSNLPDLAARVQAVHRVREEPGFLSVALAAKRIANIVKDAPEYEVSTDLLREPAEQELHRAAASHREIVREAEAAGEYERCLREIADLAEVLDRFFVEVLVMDENQDLRQNRVGLLQSIQRMISRTARLTEVVVDKSEHRDRTAIDN